jgi:rRNA maturation RNase YbeY
MIAVVNAHPTTRLRRAPIATAVEQTLRGEKIRRWDITVVLVSDAELLRMNREFLQHDYFTDVITFPMESEPLEGEIYISVDRAREQAAQYGVGVYDEVCRLAIHGALHLAGHDDATPQERAAMSVLEDRYLATLHQAQGNRKKRASPKKTLTHTKGH